MLGALRKGFGLTFKTMFRGPVTIQYPEVKRPTAPRFHGRHVLNRHPDGLEKCVGCELCAWACPADAIYVQGEDNTPEARYSPGERYAVDYQINYLRCILCGLCIEACPTRALTMTNEYELSADSREALIFNKERLLAPLPEGAQPTPHTDAEVRARGLAYYEDNFAGQDPLAERAPEYVAGARRTKSPLPVVRIAETRDVRDNVPPSGGGPGSAESSASRTAEGSANRTAEGSASRTAEGSVEGSQR